MPRSRVSMPPEAIRIEDEVWQEAFTRREPSASRGARGLRAVDGGRLERPPAPPSAAPRAPRATRPVRAEAAAQAPQAVVAREAGGGVAGRRTVTIRGRGAERNLPWPDASRRRPARRAYERAGFKPDRVAMWAVLLGILLVFVAIASAHS